MGSPKKEVPPLVASPLRGGGGDKRRATKEKEIFLKLSFLFCSQLIIIDTLLKTLRRNIKIELNYVVGWQS